MGLPFVFMRIFQHNDSFRYFIESLFKVGDISGSTVLMLPLGYSIGTLINGVAFWIIFQRDFGSFNRRVLPVLWQSLQAAIIGSFVAYIGLSLFDNIFDINTALGLFLQGLCAGLIGILASASVFLLLKNQEIKDVWKALMQRIVPDKIIVSEPDKIEV
jgi:hypothetical protein